MKELEKVPKELTPPHPSRAVSLAAYVAEDGLVCHQWEERLLVL